MDFWRVIAILSKRKGLILLSIVVTTVLTYGVTRILGATWVATVRLVLPQALPFTSPMSKGGGPDSTGPEYGMDAKEMAKNQAAIYEAMVTSRDVIEPALQKLPGIQPAPGLLAHVTVQADTPRMFELQVTDASPSRARDLANALAESLVDANRNINSNQVRRGVQLLEEQVRQADARLMAAHHRYDVLRVQHHVTGDLANNLTLNLSHLHETSQARDDVNAKLVEAQAQIRVKEQELAGQPQTVALASEGDNALLIKQLREALAKLELQLVEMRGRYENTHPAIQRLLRLRDAMQTRLNTELTKPAQPTRISGAGPQQPNPIYERLTQEIEALNQQVAGYRARLATIDTEIHHAEADMAQLKGLDSPLSVLTTEITEQTEARSNLAARLNSARLALDVAERQNPLTIMDPVNRFNPPINSSAGRVLKLIILSAVSAFLVSSALILMLDSSDRRLKTIQEAETVLPGRVLAAIPQPIGPVSYATLARAAELHPQSLHAEAYRFLGMHLLREKGPRVRSLMVLAAKPEQGSTTTISNLGITLAQAGLQVVLVDANVRTPELHRAFALPNDFGFTDLLQDANPLVWEKALCATTVPHLRVIPSGAIPHNAWELLCSPRLRQVAEHLCEIADFVLYDTPSALVFTDALNLAPVVDAAFLCVRALEPLTGGEQRLIELLEESDVKVLGNVISDVPASVVENSTLYQHYFGSGDGGSPPGVSSAPPQNGNDRYHALISPLWKTGPHQEQ